MMITVRAVRVLFHGIDMHLLPACVQLVIYQTTVTGCKLSLQLTGWLLG